VILATLDTGALIAMERQKPRGMMLLRAAREHRAELLAITPVIAEWWRGRSDLRDRVKTSVTLVPFPVRAAEASGMALGHARGTRGQSRMSIDLMVMAFAATYGGALVYTSDVGDLQAIGTKHFPDVRVLGV
jgi:predicted nucleic acid-binding protein